MNSALPFTSADEIPPELLDDPAFLAMLEEATSVIRDLCEGRDCDEHPDKTPWSALHASPICPLWPHCRKHTPGLHAQNRPAARAVKGERTALNITGARLDKDRISRGDWVLAQEIHNPTATLDVHLKLLDTEPKEEVSVMPLTSSSLTSSSVSEAQAPAWQHSAATAASLKIPPLMSFPRNH